MDLQAPKLARKCRGRQSGAPRVRGETFGRGHGALWPSNLRCLLLKPKRHAGVEPSLLSLQRLSTELYDTIVQSAMKRPSQTEKYTKARQGGGGELTRRTESLSVNPESRGEVGSQSDELDR